VLRQRVWLLGREVDDDGTLDVQWYAADGRPMGDRWHAEGGRLLQMALAPTDGSAGGALVVVNGTSEAVEVTLPGAGGRLLWDSTDERPHAAEEVVAGTVTVPATSLRVYTTT
jgi:isoamylase